MKEAGLMFKAPLVRAILSGQKTQTRRIAKDVRHPDLGNWYAPGALVLEGEPQHVIHRACPWGQPGDRIYVRDTFWAWGRWETRFSQAKGRDEWNFVDMTLQAGRVHEFLDPLLGKLRRRGQTGPGPTWWKRPGILMPKAAARIWLEITGVRVERLQAISEQDAEAEGCERLDYERHERVRDLCPKCGGTRLHDALGSNGGVIHDVDCLECDTYVKRFRHLWESTGGDWSANPWVWVIDFKRITHPHFGESPVQVFAIKVN